MHLSSAIVVLLALPTVLALPNGGYYYEKRQANASSVQPGRPSDTAPSSIIPERPPPGTGTAPAIQPTGTGTSPTSIIPERSPPGTAPAVAPTAPAQTSSPNQTQPGTGSGQIKPCTSEIDLAAGILTNIGVQQNELSTVNAMGNILAQNPVNANLYAQAQQDLLLFVTQGISIREQNQALAPVSSVRFVDPELC
jgi:hypothetical protein